MKSIVLIILFFIKYSYAKEVDNFKNTSSINILNKITAKSENVDVKVFSTLEFGNLSISISSCWHSPEDQNPEDKALFYIRERKSTDAKFEKIFHGWMFSSSPSLSGLERPVYDVTLNKCFNTKSQ